MERLLKLFLLITFCGLIPYSCGCYKTYTYFQTLKDFSISPLNKENRNDTDTIWGDTLTIVGELKTTMEEVVSNFTFTPSAYASTCPVENLGLKHKIDSVIVTTDKEFHGIPANQSINSLITFSSSTLIEKESYSQVINALNLEPYYFDILMTKDSSETFTQKFKIFIYTDDGKRIESETNKFTWK